MARGGNEQEGSARKKQETKCDINAVAELELANAAIKPAYPQLERAARDAVKGGRGVIVRARGPGCFVGAWRTASNYVQVKAAGRRRRLGWTAVAVPHWEWDAPPSLRARLAYLVGRPARAGFWTDPPAAAIAAAAAVAA